MSKIPSKSITSKTSTCYNSWCASPGERKVLIDGVMRLVCHTCATSPQERALSADIQKSMHDIGVTHGMSDTEAADACIDWIQNNVSAKFMKSK